MAHVPYEIALDRDQDRGLDRYTIRVADDIDAAQAHRLGDWLAAAAQNPTATFRLDVTSAQGRPLRVLLDRSSWLRASRKLEIVRRRASA